MLPLAPFFIAICTFCVVRWLCEQQRKLEEQKILDKKPHSGFLLVLPHMMKFVWFILVVLYEWHTFSSLPWFPKFLGGAGIESVFADDAANELGTFYQVQLAYHVHSMIFSFLVGSKLEMHVHHFVTILLISGSDMFGFRRCGIVVFLLHDTPDIVGCAIKASLISGGSTLTVTLYAALLFVWAFFRMYLLPVFIIEITRSEIPFWRHIMFVVMLSSLVVLHCFWYVQFLIMGWNFAKKGKRKDISEKSHPPDVIDKKNE